MFIRGCATIFLLSCNSLYSQSSRQDKAASSPSRSLFEYDATAPPKVHDEVLETFKGGSVHDITYESINGRTVHAYLVRPSGKGPYGAIVFEHWANGTRAEFLAEAKLYAKAGAVSLLPSYSWDLPGGMTPNHFDQPQLDREIESAAVIDCRRGIDLLLSRKDVDSKRLALVGHSFGAQWVAILTAIDRRMATSVLIAGAGEEADILTRGHNPAIVNLRKSTPGNELENYSDAVGDMDAIRFIGQTEPTPVLMQFGKFDQYFDMAAMQRYATAASAQTVCRFYDADHEVNDPRALVDRKRWLVNHLRLSAIRNN
jgi:dienelactone hydrolase